MEVDRACHRCKRSLPIHHLVGVRGNTVKICASCRGRHIPSLAPSSTSAIPELAPPQPPTPPISVVSSSPRSAVSLPLTTKNADGFASSAYVLALEQRLDRLERSLERRIDQRFAGLLGTIQASQASQAPPPPSTPERVPALSFSLPQAGCSTTTPTGLPEFHSTGAVPNAGMLPNLLSASRCFAWLPSDTVSLVERDQLKPEQLVRLRNPESRVTREPARTTGLIIDNGTITVADDSTESRTCAFVKAIPNLAALGSVWIVYISIRGRHTGNLDLVQALLAHFGQLIEFDATYQWKAVANYHLAVCRKLFGTPAVQEWAIYDQQLAGQQLLPSLKPAASTQPSSTSRSDGSSSRQQTSMSKVSNNSRTIRSGSSNTSSLCHRFNAGKPCSGCARQHVCLHCKGPHPMLQCVGLKKTGSIDGPLVACVTQSCAELYGDLPPGSGKLSSKLRTDSSFVSLDRVAKEERLRGSQSSEL